MAGAAATLLPFLFQAIRLFEDEATAETRATIVSSSFTSELKMCLNGFKGAGFKMSRLHCPVCFVQ